MLLTDFILSAPDGVEVSHRSFMNKAKIAVIILPFFIKYPKIGDNYNKNSMIIAIFANIIK